MPRWVSLIVAVLTAAGLSAQSAPELAAPPQPGTADSSLKLAVIGDNGTGEQPEYDTAQQMVTRRSAFPFEAVLMLGDNMYGSQNPPDFIVKFERPFAALLSAGVPFYATLGNHDKPSNRFYEPFNMHGERYYTYVLRGVRFVVLDTNVMDTEQLKWAEATLTAASEPWKICYFHHPLYSDAGRHGSNIDLRVVLEPILVKGRVQVVLSGHEHVYERLKPQKGITYFVAGSGGQLRKGDLPKAAADMAAGYDQDRAFMLVDITDAAFTFQVISRTGETVDSGVVRRVGTT
jgi:3',5'-cyclic AMP phosphodiesterase CpdA